MRIPKIIVGFLAAPHLPSGVPLTLFTKSHEVLAVSLKGVIKGLRTGLATCRCRCLYSDR
jgi:hypothetical protein